jgi:hypothetical protein
MYRAGPGWIASLAVSWSAPSHPMFVSLAVARLWAYAGAELTIVPAALSMVYAMAVVALVVGSLDARTRRAWVAGAVVMAPFTFSHLVAAQTADLPLGLFVTASLVVLRGALGERDDAQASRAVALAGLLGGCAALTKNEGFVFLAASAPVVAWIAVRRRRPGAAVWWGAGALPLVALMLWFKLTFPVGTPEYFARQPGAAGPVQLALDVDRLRGIGTMTMGFWWRWGGTMAMGALVATAIVSIAAVAAPGERGDRGLAWVVAAMIASYYLVWVLSPMDTTWLVGTTFDRLLAQVWPTLVLLAASGTGTSVARPRRTT